MSDLPAPVDMTASTSLFPMMALMAISCSGRNPSCPKQRFSTSLACSNDVMRPLPRLLVCSIIVVADLGWPLRSEASFRKYGSFPFFAPSLPDLFALLSPAPTRRIPVFYLGRVARGGARFGPRVASRVLPRTAQ